MEDQTSYTVSVDKAILNGVFFVNIPALLIAVSIPFAVYYSTKNVWITLISIVLGIGLGYGYWLVAVNRWKIWALTNVRNVHELYEKAIEKYIINKPGSFLAKEEFSWGEQKVLLQELYKRFDEPDLFEDDMNVPFKTGIYYSKTGFYLTLPFTVGCLYFAFFDENMSESNSIKMNMLALALTALTIYFGVKTFSSFPVLILSEEGIQVKNEKPIDWVNGLLTVEKDHALSNNLCVKVRYFDFKTSESKIFSVDLDDLKISRSKLEHLVKVYRYRYEQKYLEKIS